jgi:hypothetical protein
MQRLATLLLGEPAAAAALVRSLGRRVLRDASLDDLHLDRLVLLRARERMSPGPAQPPSHPDGTPPLPEPFSRLAQLPHQQRESWVLVRVQQIPARDAARRMDCSLTAMLRHLEQADVAMQASGWDEAGMIELRAAMDRLDADAGNLHGVTMLADDTRSRLVAAAILLVVAIVVIGALLS